MPDDNLTSTRMLANKRTERLLLVDDETSVRKVLRRFLENQGYNIEEAGDGDEAWVRLEQMDFDVVISDVNMPRKTGTELLLLMRQHKPHVPVIIITGVPSVEAAVECMRTGAFEYISKPFDLNKLHAAVQKAATEHRNAASGRMLTGRGRAIAGYQLVRTLGEGNSGIVFLARRQDNPGGGTCALKILKTSNLSAEQRQTVLHRFLNEAEAASKIKHPNVINFIEYGLTSEDNIPYMVMEFFDGHPLEYELHRQQQLNLDTALALIKQLAMALQAIHAHGICHRDIKPGNILVNLTNVTAKINDFGIAKLPESSLTCDSSLMGSPAYMAPEAFHSPDIDHRADIFSLGVVAYELLLGQRPFLADSVAQLSQQIQSARPPAPRKLNPELPPALEKILSKMLQKRPKRRYQSATELLEALDQLPPVQNTARPTIWQQVQKQFSRTWS